MFGKRVYHKIGSLNMDTGEFVPEDLKGPPMAPEMFGVYYDSAQQYEPGYMDGDEFYYVTGIMGGNEEDGWQAMLGYLDEEQRAAAQAHLGPGLAKLAEQQAEAAEPASKPEACPSCGSTEFSRCRCLFSDRHCQDCGAYWRLVGGQQVRVSGPHGNVVGSW